MTATVGQTMTVYDTCLACGVRGWQTDVTDHGKPILLCCRCLHRHVVMNNLLPYGPMNLLDKIIKDADKQP